MSLKLHTFRPLKKIGHNSKLCKNVKLKYKLRSEALFYVLYFLHFFVGVNCYFDNVLNNNPNWDFRITKRSF